MLQARFLPPRAQRELRDRTRDRTPWVPERTRASDRVQGVLQRATITLASVAPDILGVFGRALLAALIEGRTDPATMAELAPGRWRRESPVLAQALPGLVRDQHRRWWAMQGAHSDVREAPLAAVNAAITRRLTALRAAPTPPAATGGAGEVGSPSALTAPAPPCPMGGP